MLEFRRTDISALVAIPPQDVDRFAAASGLLIEQVGRELGGQQDISELIGHNPPQIIEIYHQQHVTFMLTVFRLNSFDLLIRIIPWYYRTYHSQGFSYHFFLIGLQAWKKVLQGNCSGHDSPPICAVYDWMICHHETLIELARTTTSLGFTLPHETDDMQQIFTALLLNGDHNGCLTLVEESITTPAELRHFYEHVVRYSLYTIGSLWERNEISVAEEHLATAVVGRVTSYLYRRFIGTPHTKGTVIVSSAPNEFHEVGARMVADILELDGWDVTYLGANTPIAELLRLIEKKMPFLLAVSVATPFNLEKARMTIDAIREVPEFSTIKILVGGLAFGIVPLLWQEFGADGYAANLEEVVALCNGWWQKGSEIP